MIKYFKYPRTHHLPWSLAVSNDDKMINDVSTFDNKDVVITLKMDGENTTIYNGKIHARSIDSRDHESRHWVKTLANNIGYKIPKDWRICGENLFAKHSIYYENLKSYFMVFNIWDENNNCIEWNLVEEFCKELNLIIVPVIYKGMMLSEIELNELFYKYELTHEGYVVRISSTFSYKDFNKNVAKFVRANHVQTNKHWMNQEIIMNKLEEN